MTTIKQILNAFGKASSRNLLPVPDTDIAIVPDYKNWDYRYYPTTDGILSWIVYSVIDVSVLGGYSTMYLRTNQAASYWGGYCFVKKGWPCTIFFEQSDTTAQYEFWIQPLRYES